MGVNLGDLVVKQPLTWGDLAGKTVAVDAYNALYQFLSTIRQPDGTPLKDHEGRVTSHLNGLFNRTAHMVTSGVFPIYVFDGTPHPLKRATLDARRALKERAQEAYTAAIEAGDLATARSKAQQTSTLTREMVEQAKELLAALGLPFVVAPSEGEAQACFMVQTGVAHFVASQDYDAILFGAPRLVRNLSVGTRRKLPGRTAWVEVAPEQISLADTMESLRLKREQIVDMAILMGTDYNPGVTGIGPKTALELIREHGSLEDLLEQAETGAGTAFTKLRKGQEGLGDFEAIRNLFLEPPVERMQAPKPGRVDENAVRKLLVETHRFSPERVKSQLDRILDASIYRTQRTLGEF